MAEYDDSDGTRFADPGYQDDKKPRYRLSNEKECRAAWSYIHQAKNRKFYTAEQLKAIEGRIKAAGKRYGIEFSEDVQAAAAVDGALSGVELARPGPWQTKTGQHEFTVKDLRDAADFFATSGGQSVPIKLGHDDDRFDGEPSFGSVTNVRYAEDDRGPVLLGDIVDMPEWLAASAPKRWPNRSIEGWQNFKYDGREYSLILSGLAFLGVTPPAMRNIRSLSDLKTAIAASSAVRVFASAPVDDLAAPPQAPALEAEEIPEVEESGMDPAKIREALGLAPDASDDEVSVAFNAALPPPTITEPAAAPVQASLFDPPAAKAPAGKPEVDMPGTMRVDASAWTAAQDRIKALEGKEAQRLVAERDSVIGQAVREGKFAPARKSHWVRLWDADPDGARQAIEGLAKNVIPVMASGYTGDDSDEFENDIYRELFGQGANRG